MPDRPIALLPIITRSRELDARALLAAYLLQAGYRVVTGRSDEVNAVARGARDCLYISPLLVKAAAPRLASLRERGNRVIAWDEEGLVYPDPDWYFSNRVSAESARHADAVLAWGPEPGRDLAATLPAEIGPILPFGNARIDLLREPFRRIYDKPAQELRDRFGRFILVNTNFDLVNHADGPGGLEKRMRASGRIASVRDEQRFADWAVFRQAGFDAFMEGLPILHDALPEVTFVLRPHPSENTAPWRELADRLPRISLQPPAGPVYPWIVASEAVLHNSCTTAVEAYLLDIPVVAFHPAAEAGSMDSPLPNLLSRPAHSWPQAAELLREAISGDRADWIGEEQRSIARNFIGGLEGPLSSERIVTLAEELGMKAARSRLAMPPPVNHAYRGARRLASRLLRRPGLPPDVKARFPGLTKAELASAMDRFSDVIRSNISIRQMSESAFMLEQCR